MAPLIDVIDQDQTRVHIPGHDSGSSSVGGVAA